MTVTPTDVIAGLALLLSAYATWKTIQFNDRQRSMIETQEHLNKRLLEKEDAEANEEKKADLGAIFVKLGSSNYRLKIWNKGKAVARNVQIDFPGGNEIVVQSDVEQKFPLEALEPFHSVELIASVHMGSKSKHEVRLRWADAYSETNEKVTYPTL
jgi:glycosyltransferase involved in cell wall biosynthesis